MTPDERAAETMQGRYLDIMRLRNAKDQLKPRITIYREDTTKDEPEPATRIRRNRKKYNR